MIQKLSSLKRGDCFLVDGEVFMAHRFGASIMGPEVTAYSLRTGQRATIAAVQVECIDLEVKCVRVGYDHPSKKYKDLPLGAAAGGAYLKTVDGCLNLVSGFLDKTDLDNWSCYVDAFEVHATR